MHANYTAIDGYSVASNSVGAWLMSDVAANLKNDISANDPPKNLTVNGSITTSAVNTGAETLAASGFSASNYYSHAYDAAFDPGTSGLSLKLWYKQPGDNLTIPGFLFQRDSVTTAQYYHLYMDGNGIIFAVVNDGTTARSASSNPISYEDDDNWHCAAMVFDGSTIYLYIDGNLISSATGSALNTLSNGSAIISIGNDVRDANIFLGGSIAGVELSVGNQWTAQEIKNKYNFERVLFQPYAPYSQVGAAIDYEVDIGPDSLDTEERSNPRDMLSGKRRTIVHWQKRRWDCQTVPIKGFAEREKLRKFLYSTSGQIFTFDELGTQASPVEPVSVYQVSRSAVQNQGADISQASFSVRES